MYLDWLVLSARLLVYYVCCHLVARWKYYNVCRHRWPSENITIYIYLVVFPCGYVRILPPVVICTVIFVTTVVFLNFLYFLYFFVYCFFIISHLHNCTLYLTGDNNKTASGEDFLVDASYFFYHWANSYRHYSIFTIDQHIGMPFQFHFSGSFYSGGKANRISHLIWCQSITP